MEIGVCTGLDAAGAAAAAGFEFIEASARGVLVPESPDEEFAPLAAEAKALPVKLAGFNLFLPGDLKVVGPNKAFTRMREWAGIACKRCAELGAEYIVFGSGGARKVPDGFDPTTPRPQMLEFLDMCGGAAWRNGVTVVVEPLNAGETNTINTLAEAIELCEAVNRDHLKALVDLYHLAAEGESLEVVAGAGDLLRHVHVAEPPDRLAPGRTGYDYVPFMKALKAAGYDGRISIECRWEDFASEAPGAIETLREAWEKA